MAPRLVGSSTSTAAMSHQCLLQGTAGWVAAPPAPPKSLHLHSMRLAPQCGTWCVRGMRLARQCGAGWVHSTGAGLQPLQAALGQAGSTSPVH